MTFKPKDWTGFHVVDPDSENENDSPPLAGNSHNVDREQTEQTEEEDDNSNDKYETIGILTKENDNLKLKIKEQDK